MFTILSALFPAQCGSNGCWTTAAFILLVGSKFIRYGKCQIAISHIVNTLMVKVYYKF